MRTIGTLFLIMGMFVSSQAVQAVLIEYDLSIAEEDVTITEKTVRGMTINGGIPGPVLRFREGDTARIHVRNRMHVETSIHWHGVLVPPGMDGVPNLSFPPIAPGTTFSYEFPIRQSGTYWYHSHTDLQEQRGVYGAIVIEPKNGVLHADREYVVLLSDWTDEDPYAVLRTLKRGSEWYAIEKGNAQSIIGSARLGMLGDYFMRELQRMPPMDISDVAYDRFLANGMPAISLHAEPGERIRLRIVDGSATTYFHLEFSGGPMTVVSADGIDVEPFQEDRMLIGVAETYDVILEMPKSGSYEFRATAHDGSGYASVWIGNGTHHGAPDVPKPNLYHSMGGLNFTRVFALTPAGGMGMSDDAVDAGLFDRPGMMDKEGMDHMVMYEAGGIDHQRIENREMGTMDHGTGMSTGSHDMQRKMEHTSRPMEGMDKRDHTISYDSEGVQWGKRYGTDYRILASDISSAEALAHDGMDQARPWAPYDKLRATKPTAFPKERQVRQIRLTLDGDMERYVWFMDNRPLSESDSILIRKGEVVRFIMINRTMMHHPMHLHGHFFRVVNAQGDYSPLKHTVDVAPMSTTVIEFYANEFGDWFFHCHLLYHMKSGMARVVHYDGYLPDPGLSQLRTKLSRERWYFWGQADVLTSMTEGFFRFSSTRNIITAHWEAGWQQVDATEWEGIVTWGRFFNRFFTAFVGGDFQGEGDGLDESRAVIGLRYLLPFTIESRVWVDSEGGARINLEKEFRLTPRIDLFGEGRYDTHDMLEGKAGISYAVSKSFSLMGQWHSDYQWGGGLQLRF